MREIWNIEKIYEFRIKFSLAVWLIIISVLIAYIPYNCEDLCLFKLARHCLLTLCNVQLVNTRTPGRYACQTRTFQLVVFQRCCILECNNHAAWQLFTGVSRNLLLASSGFTTVNGGSGFH